MFIDLSMRCSQMSWGGSNRLDSPSHKSVSYAQPLVSAGRYKRGVRVREYRRAWWIFIDHKGRQKRRRIGVGKAGQRAAIAVAENFQARLALGDMGFLEPAPMTFAEYAQAWLTGYVAANLKPGAQEKYAEVLRKHCFPSSGIFR
jgi:hypothetical protein